MFESISLGQDFFIKLLILCPAGFLAAMVDSIAGGGGLISVPAYLMAGVPPHLTLGTNKFSSTAASFTSSLKFARSGKVSSDLLKFIAPLTLVGAVLGVTSVLKISQAFLSTLVLVLILAVGLYTVFSKNIGLEDKFKGLTKKNIFLGMILALSLGFYDGFFGPGTGSFLIFGLISIFGFDFVKASGNGKVLNFISNITSLVMFALNGQINYMLGIPVAICMIFGARIGTVMALKRGAKLIKPIFIAMSLGVAIKMLYQMIF
ncbi:TSUP family transporter [Clostridium swellfunianum]|uniref:TSUP family transporter n=1 Tax=Clostridium swellfunianum TaxID=1367462 RepID=UPI0025492EB3|nr:TSUP family transporter [Clostridium swellfunianum]